MGDTKLFYKSANKTEKIYKWILFIVAIILVSSVTYYKVYLHPEMTESEYTKDVFLKYWYVFLGIFVLMTWLWYKGNKTGLLYVMRTGKESYGEHLEESKEEEKEEVE